MKIWHSALFAFLVGALLIYYWRSLGDMTFGRIYPAK